MKILLLPIAIAALFFTVPLLVKSEESEMTGLALPPSTLQIFQNSQDPTQGSVPQAIGFYAKGSLKNAVSLPDTGDGFVKIFRPRNRRFSTFDLNYILQEAAHNIRIAFPHGERMQVGDICSENGGLQVGHESHQNGLDVDIAFFRRNFTEQDPSRTDGFEEEFVTPSGKLTQNFDMERNWAFVKEVVSTNRVNRIFVNAAVKTAFCNYTKQIGEYEVDSEYLRRLRAWPGHTEHFHLRIDCPINSKECISQDEVPPGSGC